MKSYLITDPSIYSHDIDVFKNTLTKSFTKHQPDFALYRDKGFKEYEAFANVFVSLCHKHKVKALLHNHAALASNLNAFGVHFSSDKLCSIGVTSTKLFQVLSCHSLAEIKAASKMGIDAVTFSPIFFTPNKGEPKGIEALKDMVMQSNLPIIALGGIIDETQIKAIDCVKSWAFASIRYFKP